MIRRDRGMQVTEGGRRVGKERGGFREMVLRVGPRQKCVSLLERE